MVGANNSKLVDRHHLHILSYSNAFLSQNNWIVRMRKHFHSIHTNQVRTANEIRIEWGERNYRTITNQLLIWITCERICAIWFFFHCFITFRSHGIEICQHCKIWSIMIFLSNTSSQKSSQFIFFLVWLFVTQLGLKIISEKWDSCFCVVFGCRWFWWMSTKQIR